MEELLSLKWNNHRSTFLHILSVLRDKQLYTDATLACDGKFYNVHRLVLSTCSDYFSAMFDRTTTCKNPIIVLKDIKCQDLEALLDYMYMGEVNVRQADLSSLIKAAECLRVKGLAVPDDEPPSSKRSKSDTSNVRRSSDGQNSPASKRKRREPTDPLQDSTRPKSPQNRLTPEVPKEKSAVGEGSVTDPLSGVDTSFVKVEQEDDDDIGIIDNFESTEFKEEIEKNDSSDPGGSNTGDPNDLTNFMQQSGADGNFDPGFEGSSFPHDDSSWQGEEGSDMNYPGQLDYDPNDSSSQTGQGTIPSATDSSLDITCNEVLKCPFCGKECRGRNRKQNLNYHMNTHKMDKPYLCPYCNYSANQPGTLKAHVFSKHSCY